MSLTVKFYHKGETRRFPFEPPKSGPVFALLVQRIRTLEPDLDLTKTSLFWKDDEEDYIVMKTAGDVREALKNTTAGLLKVYAMEKVDSLSLHADSVPSSFSGPVPISTTGDHQTVPPFTAGGPEIPPSSEAPSGAGSTEFQLPDLPGLPNLFLEKIRLGVQAASKHHALYQAQVQKFKEGVREKEPAASATLGQDGATGVSAAVTEAAAAESSPERPVDNSDSSDEDSDGEHRGILCDKCDKPIRGKRFKCIVCRDFDLCEECEATRPTIGDHDSNHPVLRISRPTDYKGWMPFLIQGLHGMPGCPPPPPGYGLHPAGSHPGFGPPPFAMWGSGRRGHGHHHHKHGGMGKHGWKQGGQPEWANKEAGEQQQQGATNPEQGDQPPKLDEPQGQGRRVCGRGGFRGGPPGWRRWAWMNWVSDMRQAFENSLEDSGQRQQEDGGSQQQNKNATDGVREQEDLLKTIGSQVADVLDAFGIDVEVHTEDSCKTDCPANKKSTTTTTTKSKTTTTNADGTTTTTETPMETTVQQGDKEPSYSAEMASSDMVEGTGSSIDWVMLQPSAPPATTVQPAMATAADDQGSHVAVTGTDSSTNATSLSSSSTADAQGGITHGNMAAGSNLPVVDNSSISDAQISGALEHMLAMGYTNEEGWLNQLLIAKHGDISAVLDVLAPVNRTPSMQK